MFFFRHTFLVYIPQGWSETNATVCGYGMLCWNLETLIWQVGNPWICHLLIGVINIYQPVTVRGIILQVPSKPHARQTVIIHLKQPYFGRVTCIYSIIRDVAGFGCDQIHRNIHCPINSVYFHLKTQFTCTHKITLYMYIYIYVCTYLSIPSGSIKIIHKPENSWDTNMWDDSPMYTFNIDVKLKPRSYLFIFQIRTYMYTYV